jgi:hypothetical protein
VNLKKRKNVGEEQAINLNPSKNLPQLKQLHNGPLPIPREPYHPNQQQTLLRPAYQLNLKETLPR